MFLEMSKKCLVNAEKLPENVRERIRKYPGSVQEISLQVQGNVQHTSGNNPRYVLKMSGQVPGNVQEISGSAPGKCPGFLFLKMSRKSKKWSEGVQDMSLQFLGNDQDMSERNQGYAQEMFRTFKCSDV